MQGKGGEMINRGEEGETKKRERGKIVNMWTREKEMKKESDRGKRKWRKGRTNRSGGNMKTRKIINV